MASEMATYVLNSAQAGSWPAAAGVVLRNICRNQEPSLEQVLITAQKLREANRQCLEKKGAYNIGELATPADADSRPFSKFKPGVQIFLSLPICPPLQRENIKVVPKPAAAQAPIVVEPPATNQTQAPVAQPDQLPPPAVAKKAPKPKTKTKQPPKSIEDYLP